MVQIRMVRRLRIRSSFDVRWLLVMGLGVAVSVAYYALLIWAGLWVVHVVIGWVAGS